MRAVIVDSPGQILIRDAIDPVLRESEVMVGVQACGISRTDRHIVAGDLPHAQYPIIPGREFAGQIVACGPSAPPELAEGMLVAVDPSLACGTCRMCRAGRGNLCERWNAIGDTVDGGFAEYVSVPAANVYPLPPELNAHQGALVEPTSWAIQALRRLGPVAQSSAVIFGGGTMGLLLLQLLQASGASAVTVVDRMAHRLRAARRLGAYQALADPADLAGERFDVAVDSSGSPSFIEMAFDALKRGGRLLIPGVVANTQPVLLPPFRICHDEIIIVGSMAVLNSFDPAITAIASGAVQTGPLLGEPLPLERFPDALDAARAGRGIKVQVSPCL